MRRGLLPLALAAARFACDSKDRERPSTPGDAIVHAARSWTKVQGIIMTSGYGVPEGDGRDLLQQRPDPAGGGADHPGDFG